MVGIAAEGVKAGKTGEARLTLTGTRCSGHHTAFHSPHVTVAHSFSWPRQNPSWNEKEWVRLIPRSNPSRDDPETIALDSLPRHGEGHTTIVTR